MNPISITVTGRLGDDPRSFTTRDGTDGVELRLALDLPARTAGGEGITRWVKVTAFGLLASRTAASVGKGDRVTVIADDFTAEAWAAHGVRGAARAGGAAGPGDRRVDGVRHPAHRLRRAEGGPAGGRERAAQRPAR